ncbi:MAG: type IV toxin-antitoxin system AbiEi family antitoxin [bacterium]
MTRTKPPANNNRPRSLPAWLAPIIEQFELEGRTIVRLTDIQHARPDLSPAVARNAATQLVRRGWLRPLGFRGTYEFIPGAAAGAYPSADPWIPFRAWIARGGQDIHVGGNSAAWLYGYLERSPAKHILVTSRRRVTPRLVDTYRVIRTRPAPAGATIAGLPVPKPGELFVELAQLAPRLRLDGAVEWLPRLAEDIQPSNLVALLEDRGPATVARVGFLAEVAGAHHLIDAVASMAHLRGGPYYTGPRHRGGSYYPRWRVYDTGQLA